MQAGVPGLTTADMDCVGPSAVVFAVWCNTEAKIHELITTLDMRKNEAIERTFKGVAKNFRYCCLQPCSTLLWLTAIEELLVCTHLRYPHELAQGSPAVT